MRLSPDHIRILMYTGKKGKKSKVRCMDDTMPKLLTQEAPARLVWAEPDPTLETREKFEFRGLGQAPPRLLRGRIESMQQSSG